MTTKFSTPGPEMSFPAAFRIMLDDPEARFILAGLNLYRVRAGHIERQLNGYECPWVGGWERFPIPESFRQGSFRRVDWWEPAVEPPAHLETRLHDNGDGTCSVVTQADVMGSAKADHGEPAKPAKPVDLKQWRKDRPLARGVLAYFPDALMEIANISRVGNAQHNPGKPLHWAYGKSMDHGDCILRHQADVGELDDDGVSHTAKVAWRALAQLQTELEVKDPELHARRQAQRERAARGESFTANGMRPDNYLDL